jgi:hypothetical protein
LEIRCRLWPSRNWIWLTLSDAFQADGIDLLGALHWDYRFVEKLHGRDAELSAIMAWAEAPALVPTVRLVTGEGGAGETRLAATAAALLRERGWTAGFLKPDTPATFAVAEGKARAIPHSRLSGRDPRPHARADRETCEDQDRPIPRAAILAVLMPEAAFGINGTEV